MKKLIYILIVSLASFSCTKSGLDIESGNVVGEIEVTAFSGQLTVSVETVGRWIVNEADNASWISFDVQGGVGKGAFTVSYEANMSSVVNMKSSRKARVVVTSEDYAKSDTLNIIQQGFYSDIVPSVVTPSAEIILEYVETLSRTLSVVYCSADGVSDMDAMNRWADQFDVVACGNGFIKPSYQSEGTYSVCTVDNINFVSTDLYDCFRNGTGYEVFKSIVDATYNAYNSPSKWKTVSGVKTFSTGKPLANTVLADNAINVMLDDVDKIIEGTTEGTYPAGTKQRMLDAVADAKTKLKNPDITQEEVDEIQEELEKVHADVGASMYIKTVGVEDMLKMPWYGLGVISWGSDNPMPIEYDEKTGILKMTATVDNHTAVTSQNLSDKVVRKYRMKISWNGANTWMIFGEKVPYNLENDQYFKKDQRNAEMAGYGWSSYAIVVTGGQGHLEFHARHRKGAQVMDSITNTYIKDGEMIVEDVKAAPKATALDKAYTIKKKMMKSLKGIDIKEVFKSNDEI